jgi:putative SOS response-associated peptidase YedK
MAAMCARFQFTPPEDWMEEFGLLDAPGVVARYNIAPTQPVLAVRSGARGAREASLLRWGLVPSFAGDDAAGNPLINARAESVATRPAFREPFRSRRCLIPATGFYEWRHVGGARDPCLIRVQGRPLFAFAGLWDLWKGPDGRLESCAIVTTDANTLVAPIHDRMPVLLDRSAYDLWLDPAAPAADVQRLLVPYPPAAMEAFAVSPRINRPDVDDPDCARPLPEPPPPSGQLTLF